MKGKVFIAIILILFTSCEKGSKDNDTILKFYSEAYQDAGNSVAIGEDGYFICGQLTDTMANNAPQRFGIIKAGFDGNMIGEPKIYKGYEGSANKIKVLNDGSVVCTGYILNNSTKKDVLVMHLTSGLDEIAEYVSTSPGNQYGVDIIETDEGFLILATTDSKREPSGEVTGNPAGRKDILLIRINSDLVPLPEIPAQGFNGDDEGVAVKQDRQGGYIIVGTTDRSDLPSEQSGTNIIILKLNADGSTTKPKIVGKTGDENASDFEVLSDGYLISGTKVNANNVLQGYIWKIPFDIYSDPDFEHEITLNSVEQSTPCIIKAMCRYGSNSFLLAGQCGTGLSARLLVFSVDAYGTPVVGREKIEGNTGTQIANDVVSDDSGNIIAIGSNGYEDNSMICLLKFRF